MESEAHRRKIAIKLVVRGQKCAIHSYERKRNPRCVANPQYEC